MGSGIRAEVKIDRPAGCPVAQVSAETGADSYSITKSVDPAADRMTEEFMLNADTAIEDVDVDEDLDQVFSYGSETVYRFSRPVGEGCPCECVEQFDCPIVDVHTENGALFLVFHAPDMDGLQDIISELQNRYSSLDVQRLLQSQHDSQEQNLVFVDRSELTDRQKEVLETAHEMGYFEHPKGANAGEVAEQLGITTSTLSEHLAAAQKKLLGAILDA